MTNMTRTHEQTAFDGVRFTWRQDAPQNVLVQTTSYAMDGIVRRQAMPVHRVRSTALSPLSARMLQVLRPAFEGMDGVRIPKLGYR